jgi:hypothetical protein
MDTSVEQAMLNPQKAVRFLKSTKVRKGKWDEGEKIRFIEIYQFLKRSSLKEDDLMDCDSNMMHKSSPKTKRKRRFNGFFVRLANYVGTRDPMQCRTHLQKILKAEAKRPRTLAPLEDYEAYFSGGLQSAKGTSPPNSYLQYTH